MYPVSLKEAPALAQDSCRSFAISAGWAQTPYRVKQGHIGSEQYFFPLFCASQWSPTPLWLATLIFQNSIMLFCCYSIVAFAPSCSPQQLVSSEHS